MSERWPGGLINQTAPTPANSYNTTKASGVWTLDQAVYLQSQNLWPNPNSDQYFNYNTLLLNGDGTNGAQNNTFLDSSTNNFTITRNGNTTQGSFSPYGSNWGNYFGGGGLSVPNSANLTFGTGDFTIETFVYASQNASTIQLVCDWRPVADNYISPLIAIFTDGQIWYYVSGGIRITAPMIFNQWVHVLVSRSGTTTRLFLNGTQVGSFTDTYNYIAPTNGVKVGTSIDNYPLINGYLSNFRVLKGTGVTSVTVPTAPLTAITNTQLLTCQSNRFIDNSSNNFTVTITAGTPSVQRFSPFNPTAPYSTSVIGGSGYFGSSGDYLRATNSGALDITGAFTIQCWYYATGAGTGAIAGVGGGAASWSSSNGHSWLLTPNSGGTFYWQWSIGGNNLAQITGTSPSNNGWHYIVIGYNGTTTRVWIDGVSIGTSTTGYSLPTTRNIFSNGNSPANDGQFTGYISNFRMVNGTDVYGVGNTTITVPTAPQTAITNTQLLLSYTNAGIPDLAMMNDLQTVGNAQVSTSVKKYGTGSLSFNGSSDYLLAPQNPVYDLQGDFTIEMWLYLNATTDQNIIAKWWTGGTQWVLQFRAAGSDSITNQHWRFYANNGSTAATDFTESSTTSVATGTWYYIALTRSGSSYKFFRNGTQVGSTYTNSAAITSTTDPLSIGQFSNGSSQYLSGYIDDLRITKGYARYTTTFTPPTSALPTY